MSELARRILVVLDPDYGARLLDLPEGQPAWVLESPVNMPVIEERYLAARDDDYLTGISTMLSSFNVGETREEQFLDHWLGTIDQHHNADSTDLPYTVLDVVGVPLSQRIRKVLMSEFGFETCEPTETGFVATRSEDSAARTRDWEQ